jgi:hemin uptake protein HemP
MTDTRDSTTAGPAGASAASQPLTFDGHNLDARELFAQRREIVIRHGSALYRLRLTAQNKLILTK